MEKQILIYALTIIVMLVLIQFKLRHISVSLDTLTEQSCAIEVSQP